MPHCEQARLHPARDAGFRIDVLGVVAGRLGRDHEAAGYLLAREPAGQEPQDVDLAGRKPCRAVPAASNLVPGGNENRIDDLSVQPAGSHLGA